MIPSGSMIPTLLIHDFIVVDKSAYGVRFPFTESWWVGPKIPKRGDIVVFVHPDHPGMYMIKRVLGLPGDFIAFNENGDPVVNDQRLSSKQLDLNGPWNADDLSDRKAEILTHFEENYFDVDRPHRIQRSGNFGGLTLQAVQVSDGSVFVVGDNRDRSNDSRYWGLVPLNKLMGRARWIWLSCHGLVENSVGFCAPQNIRWQRIFSTLQ